LHALAVQGGQVYSWGSNSNGQLGYTATSGLVPAAVPGLSGATAVAAGYIHSLALVGGTVYGWGDNSVGQVGAGSGKATTQPTPVAVVTANGAHLAGVTALAAGAGHSLALLSGGTVDAWGSDYYGSLGDGAVLPGGNVPYAQPVPLLSGVSSIGAGYAHSMAQGTVASAPVVARVRFSTASYDRTNGTVSLRFTRPLSLGSAETVQNFRVAINGRIEQIVASNLQWGGTTVTLQLRGPLTPGTRIAVAWGNLLDASAQPLAPGQQVLTIE
jgi:alpha-tubulin suppressor-like RCC1 family protein